MRDEFCECPDCRPDPAEVKALRARVAEVERVMREIEMDAKWRQDLHPNDPKAMRYALDSILRRAAAALAPRSERREGEPRCRECHGTGEVRDYGSAVVACPSCAPAAPKEDDR